MIKRRFYRQDHGDKDDVSDSSSSSDSEVEAQSSADEAGEEAEEELSGRLKLQLPSSSSSSSGYESEDSSADELDAADSSGKNEKDAMVEMLAKDISLPDHVGQWILKSKSVFKCRLCPKIVCLNEESLKTHLKSKRHARSEKLLSNGRLKHMLNSDGEEEVLEEDGETHAERHARILALAQEEPKKRPQGRQRQRLRMKRKKEQDNPSTKETSQNLSTKEASRKVSTKETSRKVKRRRQNV